jgi:hypothetical protein
MTVHYSNTSIRSIAVGLSVARATATLPTALASPQNIFTITGGRVILISLIGEVTTAIGAVAQTLIVSSKASVAGSTALALCAASASVATYAVGTHFTLPAALTDPLVQDSTTLSGVPMYDYNDAHILIPAGQITLTSDATNTGSVKWEMLYVPLDENVTVTAA